MKSILSDEFLHAHSNPVSAMGTLTSAFESTKIEAEPLSPEQVQRRTKKGLKLNDRFQDLLRTRPGKLTEIYD
mgnify:CR=1 FL=1